MPGGVAWRIERYAVLDSTNDEAAGRARRGEPAGLVVLAEKQRAGRGRRGRAWASPPGGLYLSALVRPRLAAADAGRLPLAAGWAVAQTARDLGLRPSLRWPNDVLLGRAKLAGVLCEAQLGAGEISWGVLGIGLNRSERAVLGEVGGVSLERALGRPVREDEVLPGLLTHVREGLAMAEGDPAALVASWSRFSSMLGGQVTLLDDAGPMQGRAIAVQLDGSLEVETEGNRRFVTDPGLVQLREVG